jgi:hypothetical protein
MATGNDKANSFFRRYMHAIDSRILMKHQTSMA